MSVIDHKIHINHKLGFGTIFVILIYTKIYSQIKNCLYIPSAINLISINDNPTFSKNWRELFDFLLIGDSFKTLDLVQKENVSFYQVYKKFKSCDFAYKEELITSIRNLFQDNFRKYLLKKDNAYVSIAIHLRCPCDLETLNGILTLPYQLFDQDYKIYDNCNSYYKLLYSGIINDIYSKHSNFKKVKLNIHSLCSNLILDEFICLLDPSIEITIHRNSAYLSFIDIIQSDYFIAGHSSFSYLALLLRESNTYIRSGFRHYVPSNVTIIKERQLKKSLFGTFFLPFLEIKKFSIFIYYYLVSFCFYSKNFFLRRYDK